MNRPLTALFAALEALLVVGIGIGIPLVPLTFLWGFQYGLQLDWTVFWRASADVWLLGHGADVLLTLDPLTAAAAGFEEAGTPFVLSIAPLGFALLTMLLALRAGRRIVETPHSRLGMVVALVVFAGLTAGVTFSALNQFARPSIWQGILWPTLVFAVGLAIGAGVAASRLQRMSASRPKSAPTSGAAGFGTARPGASSPAGSDLLPSAFGPLGRWWRAQPAPQRSLVVQSLRGGTAAVAIVTAVSAILVTMLIAVGYGQVVALYEGIHAEVLGGIALTLGQLAFVPNLVVWAAGWLVGPGFAIGTGSSVSPLATNLGPVPAIPLFGAVPTGDLALGFLGLLVPVVAGFLAGVAVRPALLRAIGERPSPSALLMTGAGVGIVGGLILGFLAAASGGAAGPGRLQDVGPDAVLVGLLAAAEIGVPAMIGLLTGRPARQR